METDICKVDSVNFYKVEFTKYLDYRAFIALTKELLT